MTQNLYSIFANGFESENVMLFRPTLTVRKQFFFYSLGYGGNTFFFLVPANNASELCILKAENSHDYTNSISNRGVTQNLYSIFGNGFESENVMLFRPTLTVGKQFFLFIL